jgi:hypothetical protein
MTFLYIGCLVNVLVSSILDLDFQRRHFLFFIHWMFVFIWKCNLWECTHHLELYLVVCQGYILFTNHIYDDHHDD